jgi:glycosyltransferase involved in cell wall biosynthesis
MNGVRMSVVVPAHDESAIIERTLARMIAGDPEGLLDVVVVANGCADDTADRARGSSPRVRVVEIAETSKTAALNAGDEAAAFFPRAYVDADVAIDADALFALARQLSRPDGPLVASPRLRVDCRDASWPSRQFFRVWEHSDYRRVGHIGSGVYALSESGRARFDAFPPVIADDRFVQQLFSADERATLTGHDFVVPAPATLRSQMRRAWRIHAGNRQIEQDYPRLGVTTTSARRHGRLMARVVRRPSLWVALPIYAYGYLAPAFAARWRSRGRLPAWNRDETSRT